MRKKIVMFTVGTMVMASMMFGCGSNTDLKTTEVEESASVEESVEDDHTEGKTKQPEIVQTSNKAPEIEDVSDTEKNIFFYRDDLKIFGKLHLPDGEGPFPLVILAHGSGGFYTVTEDYARNLAKEGIAGLSFDYIGTEKGSKSDGLIIENSVLTQAADIEAILDSLDALSYIDQKHVFLWGHSMGGLASTYVATQRPDSIQGLIALEPSYQMRDQITEQFGNPDELPDVIYEPLYCGKCFVTDALSFDIYEGMPDYHNDVLIIEGTVAPSIGAEGKAYLDRAEETFPSAKQVAVEGANHLFSGDAAVEMQELMIRFVKEHLE
ncbi:MAG: alpha/beta fold hydrolase [Eubacteriales bacterium]|nr:alpha/beta fold hydrolase [Eubacteriales bacterium]